MKVDKEQNQGSLSKDQESKTADQVEASKVDTCRLTTSKKPVDHISISSREGSLCPFDLPIETYESEDVRPPYQPHIARSGAAEEIPVELQISATHADRNTQSYDIDMGEKVAQRRAQAHMRLSGQADLQAAMLKPRSCLLSLRLPPKWKKLCSSDGLMESVILLVIAERKGEVVKMTFNTTIPLVALRRCRLAPGFSYPRTSPISRSLVTMMRCYSNSFHHDKR